MNDRDALPDVLPYLPVLVALGEVEHVTTAAAMLRMPQPTVSRIIRRVEARLGVPLVEAAGRGVRLTDSARAFIPYAQRALDAVADGLQVLQSRHEIARATVRIAFQTSLGERFVPELIRAIRREHPGLRFVLSQGARRKCLEMLTGGETDIALVSRLRPAPDGLKVMHLFDQPLCVLVADDHRWANERSLRTRDLTSESIITLKVGFGLRGSTDELFAAAGVLPAIAFEGEDLYTLRGLVASGLGVAIVPREDVPPAGCRQITLNDPAARRDMGAAVLPRAVAPSVAIVLDALAATRMKANIK
jgi:DNA-binding transcriptional LysR family regulator